MRNYFLNDCGYTIEEIYRDKYLKERFEKCLTALRNDGKIYIGSISNDSGSIEEEAIYYHGFCGESNFEIIQDAN